MSIYSPILIGEKILFGPIDHDKDAEIEARWTQNAEWARLLGPDLALPASAARLKKRYEKIEKESEEGNRLFYFTVRIRPPSNHSGDPGRLVGFARIYWIEWNHGAALIQFGIGDPADRRQGYGREALSILLRFAFDELNLFRLAALVPEYNQPALHLLTKAGFVEEVRRRQAIHRDGCRYDLIHLGLLREEWLK